MERSLITWNFPNWITVMLMAAAGYAVIFGVTAILNRNSQS